MSGARTNTLAILRGSIERIEAQDEAYSPRRSRSAMRRPMRRCRAASPGRDA